MRRLICGFVLMVVTACGPTSADERARTDVSETTTATSARSTAALEAELMEMEREFAAASAREGASAWSSRWAANGRSYFGGVARVGPEAVGEQVAPMLEELGDRFTWWPDTAVVAASGDLGYTLGQYAVLGEGNATGDTVARGHFVTVWQRQADGQWKIALDIGT